MNKLIAVDWGSVLVAIARSAIVVKKDFLVGLRANVNRQIRGPKNSTMQTTLIDLLSRCIGPFSCVQPCGAS